MSKIPNSASTGMGGFSNVLIYSKMCDPPLPHGIRWGIKMMAERPPSPQSLGWWGLRPGSCLGWRGEVGVGWLVTVVPLSPLWSIIPCSCDKGASRRRLCAWEGGSLLSSGLDAGQE